MSTIVTVNVNSHFRIYEAKIMKINLKSCFSIISKYFFSIPSRVYTEYIYFTWEPQSSILCLVSYLFYRYQQLVRSIRENRKKNSKMAATTTLPKISRTPLATPVPPSIQRANSMYGAYPPRELSSSMSLVRIPPRVNPLAPPPPRKRIQDHWETVEQHWHNDQRRILMQQREHQRYHSAWAKAFYGAPAEKEQYR